MVPGMRPLQGIVGHSPLAKKRIGQDVIAARMSNHQDKLAPLLRDHGRPAIPLDRVAVAVSVGPVILARDINDGFAWLPGFVRQLLPHIYCPTISTRYSS